MKKFKIIELTIIVMLLTSFSIVRASSATAELQTSANSVRRGDTFTVTLSVNTSGSYVSAVYGYEANQGFKFLFDTSKLELIGGEPINMNDWNSGTQDGTIALIATGSVNGGVYKLTFKVKENAGLGDTQISATKLKVALDDGSNFDINPINKSIQVEDNTVTPTTTPTPTPTPKPTTTPEPTPTPTITVTPTPSTTTSPEKTVAPTVTSEAGETRTQTTSGKDTTTAKTSIPQTGTAQLIGIGVIVMFVIVIVILKIKLKKYDKM